MKIAYFDCFAGIAGDMTLGALIDCGVPIDALRAGLASLPVEGWEIETTAVLKSGIHGLKVRVSLHGRSDADEHQAHTATAVESHPDYDEDYEQEASAPVGGHSHHHTHAAQEHGHSHDHRHPHDDGHEHHHDHHHGHHHGHHDHDHHDAGAALDHGHGHHNHPHDHGHPHGRSMAEIREIIHSSELSPRVQVTALAIFGAIAKVEAEIHHTTPEEIHFHEIGGVDSLIDICGAAWCLDYLGVEAVYCSALPYSTGTVECAHGRMPVPAPATLKLLRGAPMFPTGITGEMITPTGAGIVGALAQGFGPPPAFTPLQIGSGAGTKDWPDRPNLLRVVIGEMAISADSKPGGSGETVPAGLRRDTVVRLETNVDDMNPELFDTVFTRLFEAGALDVWMQPIQMKKNRPATLLSVLAPTQARDDIVRVLLAETSTLGVRLSDTQRFTLHREVVSVETRFGDVRVKVAEWSEIGLRRGAPEYDDVARLAREHSVAAREVYEAAQLAFAQSGPDVTNYVPLVGTKLDGAASQVPFAYKAALVGEPHNSIQAQQQQ